MSFGKKLGEKCNPPPGGATESEKTDGCFDCNICLDFAREPVVTLCGHLYCWPCIYKWLYVQDASLTPDEHPQCPVCKADISHTSMVPLYGRGQIATGTKVEGKAPAPDMSIPPRPQASGSQALMSTTFPPGQQLPHRRPSHSRHQIPHSYNLEDDSSLPFLQLGAFNHSVVDMLGELFHNRAVGNSESLYAYQNPYHLEGTGSPRLRRHEMQAEKALSRVSIFFFCCFLICLILF